VIRITGIRHAWPEKADFHLTRPNGIGEYVFVHFTTGAEILINGEYVYAQPHSCILYTPGTPQYIHSTVPLVHDWFHLSGDPAPLLEKSDFPPDTLLHPPHPSFVTDIVREMESEYFARRKGYEELILLKLSELFLKLSRGDHDSAADTVDASMSEKLRKLRGEIFLSLGYSWTVEKMAAAVGLSQSRFHTVYRALYGSSPVDDLIRARIDSAKNALQFGSGTVSSIAESLGYNDVTHFIRQFRKITGVSPMKYRRGERK